MIKNETNLTSYRINQIEENYKSLDGKVEEILTNHLPHLQNAMDSLQTRVNVSTVFNIGAIIIGLIISKFLFNVQ